MISPANRPRLHAILQKTRLIRVFSTPELEEELLHRLTAFEQAYAEKIGNHSSAGLPMKVTTDDVIEEYYRNAYRSDALLQAAAFRCSSQILALMWMVLLGSEIQTLLYEYQNRDLSLLKVTIVLPDGVTPLEFSSGETWDAALLRFLAISKADDRPHLSGFFGLYIPPSAETATADASPEQLVLRTQLARLMTDWTNDCFEAGNKTAIELGPPVELMLTGGQRVAGHARFVAVTQGFILASPDGPCVELRRSDGTHDRTLGMSSVVGVRSLR